MKLVRSFLVILISTLFFPVISSAELNPAKNEDTQTLVFEIVDTHHSLGASNGKNPLPRTNEVANSLYPLGIGLVGGSLLAAAYCYQKGRDSR